MEDIQVLDLEEAKTHLKCLYAQNREMALRLRTAEKWIDTYIETVWWKRWLFIIDGWPSHRLVDKPQWRPWRKWYTS